MRTVAIKFGLTANNARWAALRFFIGYILTFDMIFVQIHKSLSKTGEECDFNIRNHPTTDLLRKRGIFACFLLVKRRVSY